MPAYTERKTSGRANEWPMYLQRPSSSTSQDVSHVLAKTFRDLFTRDVVSPEMVKNLEISKGNQDNAYHQRYVEALQQVHQERERRIAEAAMLERHIMQAQARAMSADEREMNRLGSGNGNLMHADLGLPPARSHFRSVIDNELLKMHDLICPDDFSTEEPAPVPPPKAPTIPGYAQETKSFQNRVSGNFDDDREYDAMDLEGDVHISSETLQTQPELLQSTKAAYDSNPQFHKQYSWKEQLSTEQRMINRADLADMQAKADYLKNPRFRKVGDDEPKLLIKSQKKVPKEFCIKPKPQKKQVEDSVIFIASPSVIRFTDYQVGQVYELSVELKNVTTSLRQCRVIPPETTYFSVGLGQFPGEQGLVAPGMSCRYSVRFIPDSLGDYDDFMLVQTQASQPLVVKIEARRPPPILSLPPTVDVGQCLVGGVKIAQFPIHNAGGAGRFCLIDKRIWPSTSFKGAVQAGVVSLEPFDVCPPVFELQHNQSTMIEVKFSPDAVKQFSQEFTMVCDNCHVQYFTLTGEGQTACVELTTVEGGTSDPLPGEMSDVGAAQLIRFPNLNPYTYMQKNMVITNKTLVDLPFHWNVIKPHLQYPKLDDGQSELPENRVLDADSPFSVEPASGILQAGSSSHFKVTFAPPEVKKFHSCLHLVLENIPEVKNLNNNNLYSPAVSSTTGSVCADVTALEIEVKGESEPFSVVLQPYAMLVPGQLLMGTTIRKDFVMSNNSLSPVVFRWNTDTDNHILEVEPPIGELLPGCQLQFQLSITGSEPGKIDKTLLCHIDHLEEPLTLQVKADIKGPEITIDNSDVNFDLVSLGETSVQHVFIRNNCQIPAKWMIRESQEFSTEKKEQISSEDCEFAFLPSSGDLKPLEVMDILVKFMPTRCRSMRSVFELQVEQGNVSHISARGEVQLPKACFLKTHLEMTDVYLDVPTQYKVTLANQTRIPTKFKLLEPIGAHAGMCTLTVEPNQGELGPREQREILVNFTAHETIEVKDVRIPCVIDGMDTSLALALFCDVKGLSVDYRVCLDQLRTMVAPELKVNLGDCVQLGANVKRYLCIRNNSAITAPFNVSVEHFSARPPSPPGKEKGSTPTKSQRRSILGKTPNLADPLSKSSSRAHAEMCAMMLKRGKGAAFTVEPSSGILYPFSEEVVEITSYSDMWGRYTDTLLCRVENQDIVKIPVEMTVEGCPLVFQMTATQGNAQPVLRFGTHVSGVPPITRHMRINNTSPNDIRIDWQVFNCVQDDPQLLDFVVTYGTPFPLKDAQGNEILPTIKPPPVNRLPTDFIPDSPDTVAASRQPTSSDLQGTPALETVPEVTACGVPKVISINLRSHDGQPAEKPFRFTPSQMVVPARGFTCVAVCLMPSTNSHDPSGEEFSSFALGYLSLEDEYAQVEGRVSRSQHYDLEPIRLNITAHVKPALLMIECTEDDGMRYRTALSDLLYKGNLLEETVKINSVNLSNHTGTPLNFKLVAPPPFALTNIDPRTHEISGTLQEINNLTLTPHHNFQIHVAFRVSLDLLDYQDEDGVEEERLEKETKLHFRKDLQMVYSNGSVQRLPLHATLAVPAFHLSKESIDFGVCLVGQERHLELMLSNYSASATLWFSKVESNSKSCSTETFKITPNKGHLDGHIAHISNSKCLLNITFTAKDSEMYECVFIIKGLLGEEPRRLYVKGQGSYDEKHEALVNI